MKAHINPVKGPERCQALKGKCPFGGETGESDHFNTIGEARAVYQSRLEEAYGSTASLKKKVRTLSDKERRLIEDHKKALKEIAELRAKLAESNSDEKVPDSKELKEALDRATEKNNTYLMEKLARAITDNKTEITTGDSNPGYLIDQDEKDLDEIEGLRAAVQTSMIEALKNQAATKERFQVKTDVGTFSAFVKGDFDEDAFSKLPKKVQDACLVEKDSFDVEKARNLVPPKVFESITNQTLVLDNIPKHPANQKFFKSLDGDTTDDKITAGLNELSEIYGAYRQTTGVTVSHTRNELADLKNKTKEVHAENYKGATVYYPHEDGGFLIGTRRTIDPKALAHWTPEQIKSIKTSKMVPDYQKAKSVLPPETFKRIFEAPTITLRVTEAK